MQAAFILRCSKGMSLLANWHAEFVTRKIILRPYRTKWCHVSGETFRQTDLNWQELQPKVKTGRLVFVTTYRTEAENIKRIINRNWDTGTSVRAGETFGQILPEPPFISFSRCPAVQDKLVPSPTKYPTNMVRAPTNVTVNTPETSCK